MSNKPYYTLAVYDTEYSVWAPEFGDYDQETVQYELEDYLDHDHKRKHLKIIKTGDSQQAVNEAIAKLNSK